MRKRVSLGDDQQENFNLSFPCSLILENFFHRHGLDVKRFATMRRSDGIFKLRNLFWILHSGFFEFEKLPALREAVRRGASRVEKAMPANQPAARPARITANIKVVATAV
jgi:hypothetical protein